MFRPLSAVVLLATVTGCTQNAQDTVSYRPSMTQLRIGEVVVDNPPVIPDDNYIPGIVVAPEVFEYSDGPNQRRAHDGAGNLSDFGSLLELENPEALEKHREEYKYTLTDAALFDENDDLGMEYTDVNQGAIGDCYLAAALTSVAYSDTDNAVLDGLVRENRDADGKLLSYIVRFYDAWSAPQDIEVDAQLVRRSNKPLYARSGDSKTGAEELWVGIVEKAYAKWHGDYEKIGNGGYPGDVMQALTGAQANFKTIKYQSEASLHRTITDAVADGRPVTAGTFGEDSGVDYEGSGVYAWHAYSVLGSREVDGEFEVQLRNPWGSSEPAGNGPDDGIFWFSYRDFYRLYSNIVFGGKYERDVTAPANVTDLSVVGFEGSLAVVFTTTGDDATSGLASSYDLRVLAGGTLADNNFFEAIEIVTPDPQAPGTKVTLPLGDLAPGTYSVGIRIEDESGNSSPLSNVETFTVGSDDPPPPNLGDPAWYFDQGPNNWTTTGDWFHDGTVFWLGDATTQNYAFGRAAQGRLESPAVDLSPFANPYIIWDQILDVESGSEFDTAHLEITEDGWVTSSVIWEKNTTGDAWSLEYVYLDAYAGKTVEFAFVFDSIDDQNNDTLGWKIATVLVDTE